MNNAFLKSNNHLDLMAQKLNFGTGLSGTKKTLGRSGGVRPRFIHSAPARYAIALYPPSLLRRLSRIL
jgi:hypothetical protein